MKEMGIVLLTFKVGFVHVSSKYKNLSLSLFLGFSEQPLLFSSSPFLKEINLCLDNIDY